MKYLAILRDSLREALDSKLLYVMVGLSVLFCVFMASVTYRPVPMREEVEFMNRLLNAVVRSDAQEGGLSFGMKDFERTDQGNEAEPWNGDYRFTYSLQFPGLASKPEKLRELKKTFAPNKMKEHLQQTMPWFKDVTVSELPSSDPTELDYQVDTKGTSVKTRQEWFHEPRLFFGLIPIPVPLFPLQAIVIVIGDLIVGTWGAAVIMLISTIITAFFIPNMLSKGTIDLLLVKPINRPLLFLYKFIGGLTFMVINTAVIMGGIWFAFGIQTGMWVHSFLLCIPIFTFQFVLFYSVSALMAVLTRSPIVAILATVGAWALLVINGWAWWWLIEKPRDSSPNSEKHWAYITYDTLHAILPQYKEIDWLTSKMINAELTRPADPNREDLKRDYERQRAKFDEDYKSFSWPASLGVTSIYIVLLLGLACWRFTVKDY